MVYEPDPGDYRLEVYSLGTFVDGLYGRLAELETQLDEPDNLELARGRIDDHWAEVAEDIDRCADD